MTDVPDLKTILRKQAFAGRKRAHADRDATGAVARATAHLLDTIGPVSGRIIAGYMPIRTELDPVPAMTALDATNRICVPVIAGTGQPLIFRAWTPDADMIEGPFGAQIPASGDWLRPDILIVPLVAFDGMANRLGYGGGFYDRTLAELGQPRAFGFAYAAQKVPAFPVEPTDRALDAVVTEEGVIWPLKTDPSTLAAPGPTP